MECQVQGCGFEAMKSGTSTWAKFTLKVFVCLDHHFEYNGGETTHSGNCGCEEAERYLDILKMKRSAARLDPEVDSSTPQIVLVASGHRSSQSAKMFDGAMSFVKYAKRRNALVLIGGAKVNESMETWGWDQMVAHYCVKQEVDFKLFIPFQDIKDKLLSLYIKTAKEIKVFKETYDGPEDDKVFLERNRAMVDYPADELHVFLDGRKEGGTFYTKNYAKQKRIKVKNWYPKLLESII